MLAGKTDSSLTTGVVLTLHVVHERAPTCIPITASTSPLLLIVVLLLPQDLNAGEVCSVSFSTAPASVPAGAEKGDTNLFVAPDFVVSTASGALVAVKAGCFEDPTGFEQGQVTLMEVGCALHLLCWSVVIVDVACIV